MYNDPKVINILFQSWFINIIEINQKLKYDQLFQKRTIKKKIKKCNIIGFDFTQKLKKISSKKIACYRI